MPDLHNKVQKRRRRRFARERKVGRHVARSFLVVCKALRKWPRYVGVAVASSFALYLIAYATFRIADTIRMDRPLFGDAFGATNAIISGLALLGVAYSLSLQRQELRAQRRELRLQRQQMESSADSQALSATRSLYSSFVDMIISSRRLPSIECEDYLDLRQSFLLCRYVHLVRDRLPSDYVLDDVDTDYIISLASMCACLSYALRTSSSYFDQVPQGLRDGADHAAAALDFVDQDSELAVHLRSFVTAVDGGQTPEELFDMARTLRDLAFISMVR